MTLNILGKMSSIASFSDQEVFKTQNKIDFRLKKKIKAVLC